MSAMRSLLVGKEVSIVWKDEINDWEKYKILEVDENAKWIYVEGAGEGWV